MTVEIENVENLVSNSINFDWKFYICGNPWNVSTNEFILKEISSTCSLNMHNEYSSGWSSVRMTLTLTNYCQVILEGITLIMFHKATGKMFSFYLKKEDDNPNIFLTTKRIYMEDLFTSTNQDWKIKIVYEHDAILENSLKSDFKELLISEKHADFSIKTQNVIFKVHKGILSSRCNVLAKAIETDMIEKQKSEMQLDLWDPVVVKEFLSFIYTGSCELSINPYQLFQLAHYFQLDELKLKCTRYLKNNIKFETIVHTLELSDEEQYNLKDLEALVHSFVTKNESSLVKNVDFQEYLSKSIKLKNLTFCIRLAYTYNLNGSLEYAKEFIRQNHKEVLENDECRKYLLSQPELLLDILKFSFDSTLKTS